eukprot:425614-Amphidinium_carterae.1
MTARAGEVSNLFRCSWRFKSASTLGSWSGMRSNLYSYVSALGSGEAMAYNPKDLFQHDETSTYMQELSQPPASPSAG